MFMKKTGLLAGFFIGSLNLQLYCSRKPDQGKSNTAIDSTCAVCGNMFTTPA